MADDSAERVGFFLVWRRRLDQRTLAIDQGYLFERTKGPNNRRVGEVNPENRVVTVTINPAIDQTVAIPNFAAGKVNRVLSSQMDPGGKGINVASYLADFGQPATVTGFLGADNDDIFRRLFERKGIEDRCVRIVGQTRIGVKVS